MQEAIDDALATRIKCRKCSADVIENIEYGPHVFIDTSVFTDKKYVDQEKKVKHTLGAIAKSFRINVKNYILTGVANYIVAYDGSVNGGHYVAYARCGSRWYESTI